MQRVDSRRRLTARSRRRPHRVGPRAFLAGGLLAALLSAAIAPPPAAAAAPAILWAAARVASLRAHVVFDVSRPPIAATVTLPVPGTLAGALPAAALNAAESGISGSVAVSGGGRRATLPATLLRAQALPGALSLTYGEQTLELPSQGQATITLRLGGGQAPGSQTVSFSVRSGSPPAPPPPTQGEAAFVAELNAFRAEAGVPPVRLSAALTAAAAAHAAFVSGHSHLYGSGVSVHDEPVDWSRIAGWTGLYSGNRDQAFGSATGGGSEVMSSGNPDPVAFLVWETVFHREIMLSPSVLAAGAAYAGGQFVMDLSSPRGVAAPSQIWPPSGAQDVPTTFGGEWPSPLAPFAGAGFPAGTPVTWRDYGAAAGTAVVPAQFTLRAGASGSPVLARLLSPQNWTARDVSSTGVRLGTALALIPDAPLEPHARYTAQVSGTLTAPGRAPAPFQRTWSFTTGSEVVPSPPGFARPVLSNPAPGTLLTRPVTPPGTAAANPGGSPPQPAATTGTTSGTPAAQGTAGKAGSTSATATPPGSAGANGAAGTAGRAPATASAGTAATAPVSVARRLAELHSHIAKLPGRRFTDLWKARWARPAVDALAAAGVIHGIGSDMFDPQGTLTRAQMAVALSNLVPSPERASVAGSLPPWAVAAVRQVTAEGWMGAPGKGFRPGETVSRSAAIRALTRMMGWTARARGYAASGGAWPKGVAAPDLPAGQTRDDLLWAAHVELLRGVDGRVDPGANLTRAQFAVLLYRLLQQAAP